MAGDDKSILARLEAEGRSPPRVQLQSDGSDGPVLRKSGRFEILGELAEGGVGKVLKGRDIDLGRDVALKVLRKGHVENPELVQRFVDEAQIGGQLQHPGIVPIYELGLQDDRSPFFAMKLVKGHTLAALFKEPEKSRRKLLQIFEQVCQTVAYAHARGVIHRDIKPSNVMVGAFGEVQVLDWGFAKVLPRGGIADEKRTREIDVTHIATLRSQGEGSESMAGSVMGTPAYMPPEQALGQVELMDERSDVFSLGAMLCELLTGKPPYHDEDILMQAAQAQLDDAFARLDACDADRKLVALAKQCLCPRRKERPRDASVLAKTTHEYLADVEERAHRSALAAAESRAKSAKARAESAEQRRARRQSVLVSASVLLAILIGGTSYALLARSSRDRAQRTTRAVADALKATQRLRGEAKWTEALAAAQQAAELARTGGVDPKTHARAQALLATVTREEERARKENERQARDRAFVRRLEEIRLRRAEDLDNARIDAAYAAVFGAHGIEPSKSSPAEAGAAIRARFPEIAVDLAAALGEWAWLRRTYLDSEWRKLHATARHADPDEWRNQLRDAVAEKDLGRLHALADEALEKGLSVRSLDQLGIALDEAGDVQAATVFLRRAQRMHPEDFWINYHAAHAAGRCKPPRWKETARFYTAALAIRPGSAPVWNNLGIALWRDGKLDESIVDFRTAIRMRPDSAVYHANLAGSLSDKGAPDEAIAAAREAIRLDPRHADGHHNLGMALRMKGLVEEGLAAAREAVRLDPSNATMQNSLGGALLEAGKKDEAMAAFRLAIRIDPGYAAAHGNLGVALGEAGKVDEAITALREAIRLDPRDARGHNALGAILANKLGDTDGALAMFRRAIRLDPSVPGVHFNLGNMLAKKGRVDAAVAAFREAIRRDPNHISAHDGLALTLSKAGRFDEAIAEYRACIRLRPDSARAHLGLGSALAGKGLLDKAIEAYREALRLDPRNAKAHYNLAGALQEKGLLDEAIRAAQEAVRLDPEFMDAHLRLGSSLDKAGRRDAAIASYRRLLELEPDYFKAHLNLGLTLSRQGLLDEAIAACREAVRLAPNEPNCRLALATLLSKKGLRKEAIAVLREGLRRRPDDAGLHYHLANELRTVGTADEVIAEYREAIRLDPNHAEAHCNLGHFLQRDGRFVEALALLRRGHELGSRRRTWRYPSARWVRRCEGLAELDKRLAGVLAGEDAPANARETMGFALVCFSKKLYVAAARLYRDLFAEGPPIVAKLRRYDGACAAALAGCGKGKDAKELDDTTRAGWRRQALAWLRVDLAKKPPVEALKAWIRDPALAGVRDAAELQKLPAEERGAWRDLWKEVRAMLR